MLYSVTHSKQILPSYTSSIIHHHALKLGLIIYHSVAAHVSHASYVDDILITKESVKMRQSSLIV